MFLFHINLSLSQISKNISLGEDFLKNVQALTVMQTLHESICTTAFPPPLRDKRPTWQDIQQEDAWTTLVYDPRHPYNCSVLHQCQEWDTTHTYVTPKSFASLGPCFYQSQTLPFSLTGFKE